MKKLITLLFCTVTFFLIPACGKENKMTAKKIRSIINQELSVKDSSQDIEGFLESMKITYSYDKYNNRYQCIIRDPSGKIIGYHSIVIYINVDEQKRYVSSEVFDSYTGI